MNLRLVTLAIQETGSTEVGTVSLHLEDILHREMLAWPSYKSRNGGNQRSAVFARLERLGIYTSRDVQRLIEEAVGA